MMDENLESEVIAVDLETTGLNPVEDEIRLLSAYSDDFELVTEDVADLEEILSDPNVLKVFHNSTFDVTFLKQNGFAVNNYTDTLIIAQVVENTARGDGRSLAHLVEKYLGIYLDKSLQESFTEDGGITEEQKDYALKDAKVTYLLYKKLIKVVEQEDLTEVLNREIRALPIVVELKLSGIKFDYSEWEQVLEKMGVENKKLKKQIRHMTHNEELNLESPLQIRDALQNLGLKIDSTADDVLKKHEDDQEVVALIRQYKKIKKNLSAFGSKLKDAIDSDGRLRGNWSLIGTDTFRMGCSKPPLQAMPRASRPYFKAKEGHSLILADYKTIELRILAVITKDPELLKAFENGEDLHKKTASSIFQKKVDDIDEVERDVAKIINFGIVYGMSSFGIQKRVSSATGKETGLVDAERYRQSYFNLYRNVLNYQDSMLRACYIQTLGGRVWRGDDLDKGSVKRYNYPIQSAMAEGLKEALILLLRKLHDNQSWKVVNIIHDEIIMEVPDEEVEKAKVALEEVMIQGMKKITGELVPIEIDLVTRKSWE